MFFVIVRGASLTFLLLSVLGYFGHLRGQAARCCEDEDRINVYPLWELFWFTLDDRNHPEYHKTMLVAEEIYDFPDAGLFQEEKLRRGLGQKTGVR